MWFLFAVFVAAVCILATGLFFYRKATIPAAGKVIVVTGCDTGFGRLAVEQLVGKGFIVYAACLTQTGVKALCELRNNKIRPVLCDVTKDEDVDSLKKAVLSSGLPLWGLINNAGIIESGIVDWLDMKRFQLAMDVNYFGVVRVTKAFLDMIKESKGRIVNVGSVAGFISSGVLSPYNSSKFAVRAFSEALRYEMLSWDVHVSLIEPSFMKTPLIKIGTDKLRAVWDSQSETKRQEYGQEYYEAMEKLSLDIHMVCGDPMVVVDSMRHSVEAKYPKHTYKCGIDAPVLYVISVLPIWMQLFVFRIFLGLPIPKIRSGKKQ